MSKRCADTLFGLRPHDESTNRLIGDVLMNECE